MNVDQVNNYLPVDVVIRLVKSSIRFRTSELQLNSLAREKKISYKYDKKKDCLLFDYREVIRYFSKPGNMKTIKQELEHEDSDEIENPMPEEEFNEWAKRMFK